MSTKSQMMRTKRTVQGGMTMKSVTAMIVMVMRKELKIKMYQFMKKKEKVEEVVKRQPQHHRAALVFSRKRIQNLEWWMFIREGQKIYLNRYNPHGHFGKKGTLNDFEVSIRSIPDVLFYRGLVVIKLPADAPVTENPIVYGFVKLQSAKNLILNTANEMKFSDITDVIDRATVKKKSEGEEESKKKNSDRVKPVSHYRKLVKKAWLRFNLRDGDEVNLKKVMQILKYLNIFLLDIQARRILEAVDIEGDRELGMSEMVNFLMAYDLLGATVNIECLDIFDTLKVREYVDRGHKNCWGTRFFRIL